MTSGRVYPIALLVTALLASDPAFPAGRRVEVELDPVGAAAAVATRGAAVQPQLVVSAVMLSDNVDDDGWADTAESVELRVELYNPSAANVNNIQLRLTTDDPDVGCVVLSMVTVDSVPAGARVLSPAFEWIVGADVQRGDAVEELTAEFELHIDAQGFAAPLGPQPIVVDLDLDAAGGGNPTTYFESFEDGFGSFTTMHLDATLNPPENDLGNHEAGVINADGSRCQYNDPDWEGSAAYGGSGAERCYPNPSGAPDRFFFRIVTDRSYAGTQAMGWNVFLSEADGYTTPVGHVEALRTIDPVNLGWSRICSLTRGQACETSLDCPAGESCVLPTPRLSLKQQVSQMDHRSINNTQPERTADRGVVALQLADSDSVPSGHWVKAYPYVNVYDSQANSNYFGCNAFDPIDDGNDEGDFFDPMDPRRSHGPSSTCAPEFSFAHQGDTDALFDAAELGDAVGPGLSGATGIGTWVEPQFDLSRFRGRRLRLRFLMSSRKLGGAETWEQVFGFNPDAGDDGWFIDDVQVTDALTSPAVLVPDTKDNQGLAECGDHFCGQSGGVETQIELTPEGPTSAPGAPIRIDTSGSTVDVCLDGTLIHRFWIEVGGNDRYDPALDVLLQDWSYRGDVVDTPVGRTVYGAEVQCETDSGCGQTEMITVEVGCPGEGDGIADHANPFLDAAAPDRRAVLLNGEVGAGDKPVTLYWTTGAIVDVVRGDLTTLRSEGAFGVGETCVADNQTTPTHFVDATPTPDNGDALFWLVRSAQQCNDPGAGGSYGMIGESADRDTIGACPD